MRDHSPHCNDLAGQGPNGASAPARPPLQWMPVLGMPLAIPARLLSAPQAMDNHGQTLERLAERGGLSLDEAAALAEGRRWRAMTTDEALAALKKAGERRGVRAV